MKSQSIRRRTLGFSAVCCRRSFVFVGNGLICSANAILAGNR
jgi:hypothetical protein